MKKLFVLLTAFFFSLFAASPAFAQTVTKICVDAGHGGIDTGAAYNNLTESQETLDIATRLKTLLVNAGYQVVMTRTDMTTTLGNSQRAAICNNAGAQELVSIHLNGSTNHSVDFTEGLYGKKNKDQAFAAKVNTAMNALGITNNGITNFADGMLLKANMPATLAETVFISSDYEYNLLTDGTGNRQQQIAQALFTGLTH